MSVFRPKYRDLKTGKQKTAALWWYEFTFAGKRVREPSKSTRKTIAVEAEKRRRLELEKTLAGMPTEKRENRINSVSDLVTPYLERYELDHRERPQSIAFANGRLAHVTRLLGTMLIPDLTEDAIRAYIATRLSEGVSGRTVNMEVGELSRAIGKPWSVLWPKVRKQEERKDAGVALSPEEEDRLLAATAKSKRWQMVSTIVRVSLQTAMRSGEITGLQWEQVDFANRIITVGRAKTSSGTGRQIPMNGDLYAIMTAHADWFTERFGQTLPEYHLFPFGKPAPTDPTRPTTTLKTAWASLRKEAKVKCRLHDLRHTALTKMAEAGVPESTMLALAGHMSRAMLERYSHIRMQAKREAVEALSRKPKVAASADGVPQESPKVTKTVTVQ
jgi:integrase